jgi:hypothetical protein
MKKVCSFPVFTFCLLSLCLTVACNGQKSFEELKRDELKIIRRMIVEKDIEVLTEYPADGVFGENQFVLLSNGIYLNVIDSGNGERAVQGSTTVLVRVSGEFLYNDSFDEFSTFGSSNYPMEFKYGNGYYVVSNHSGSYDAYYYFFSLGIEHILRYVGNGAEVKLIIPGYIDIDQSSASSSYQTASSNEYIPIYYDRVKYTFY